MNDIVPVEDRETAIAQHPMMRPAQSNVIMREMTNCMALVRPVTMSDNDVQLWLAAAAKQVANLPEDIFLKCADQARDEVSHHGDIVPTIKRLARERVELRRSMVERELRPKSKPVELPKREPVEHTVDPNCPLPQSKALRETGEREGWLIRDEDGWLIWNVDYEGPFCGRE